MRHEHELALLHMYVVVVLLCLLLMCSIGREASSPSYGGIGI